MRAWQPRGGSNGHAFKGLGQSVWKYKTTELDGRTASHQRLFERLEAENGPVAELVGIEGGVVSGVFNLESSGVEAPDRRPRHEEHYHEA